MNFKNERGITLTALVVSIIVMLILASVTVQTSFTAYENTRAEKFKAQMKVIQETVYNSILPDYENWRVEREQKYNRASENVEYYHNLLLESTDPEQINTFSEYYTAAINEKAEYEKMSQDDYIDSFVKAENKTLSSNSVKLDGQGIADDMDGLEYWWNFFDQKYPAISREIPDFRDNIDNFWKITFHRFESADLQKYFGIKNLDLTVYINFKYKIILSEKSVKIDGKNIYSLNEIENDLITYDYNLQSATSDALIRIDEVANYGTSKKIKLTLNTENVENANNVMKYNIKKAYYKNSLRANRWVPVDDLKDCQYSEDGLSVTFAVFESGEYFFRIEDGDGNITDKMEQYTEFNVKNKKMGESKNYTLIEKDPETGNEKGYVIMLVNHPIVTSDMVPIKWVYEDDSKSSGCWVVCSTTDPEWYNYSYEYKKWANIMFKKDAPYHNFEIGSQIREGDTGSMFVWIPRFATTTEVLELGANTRFFLDSDNYYNIQFLRDYSNTTTFGTNAFTDKATSILMKDEYIDYLSDKNNVAIPLAFRNNDSVNGSWDSELKGLWFAKYNTGLSNGRASKMSIDSSGSYENDVLYSESQDHKAVSKPYYIAWRNISFTSAFSQSLFFYKDIAEEQNINSHLMKGTEYDVLKAITYNGEFGNKNIVGNNSNRLAGGSDGVNGYSIQKFQNQSTTGNMTGIFDLAGITDYILSSIITKLNNKALYSNNSEPILYYPGVNKDRRILIIDGYENKYLQAFQDGDFSRLSYFCGNLKTPNGKLYQTGKNSRELDANNMRTQTLGRRFEHNST